MSDLIGKTLGQYQIVELIGKGGMATVYRAHQPALNRDVVVKVLLPTLSQDRQFVERFQREARAAAALKHPHIVRIYDVGEAEGFSFMVMELVDGETLAQKLQREGALSPFIAFTIAEQIGDALDAAHRQGLIHRDVKPGNILLDKEGHAYLTDFGIAKALHDPSLTQVGTVVGTPEYMSPEQVNGQPLDGRSDLYSLAIVLYQMLTGRVPFHADTPMGTLHQQVNNPPTPPSVLGLPLGNIAEQALLRALNKEPAARFPDARTMMAAMRGQQVGTGPALTPSSTSVPVAPVAVPSKRGGSGRLVFGAAALAILVVAGIFGYSWWQSNQTVNRFLTGMANTIAERSAGETSSGAMPTQQATPTVAATSTTAPSPTPSKPAATATARVVVVTATPRPTVTPLPTHRPSATPKPRPSQSTAVPVSSSSPGLITDFETMGTWKRGDQPYGTFVHSSAQAHQGHYAGKINYNFPTAQNDYVVFLKSRPIGGTPNVIRAWVYGDGSGHFLNVWIRDNGGQTWQVPLGQVSHSGWKQMAGYIQVGQQWPWTSVAGADNGRVDYPIRFAAIVLDDYPDTYTGRGTIYIDELEAAQASSPGTAVATGTESPAPPPVAAPGGPLAGHIAFSLFNPSYNGYDVYVANADGSGRNRVVEHARQPDISRDGRIVINGEGGGTDSLWYMNLDGSQRHEVGTHPEDSQPSWSPDSSRIAMGSTLHGDGSSRIYTYDSLVRLQKPSLLMFGSYEIFGRYPTWLGDDRIAFTGCDYWVVGGGGSCGLFVVGSGGGQPVQITHGGTNDVAPDDHGTQLVFMSHRDGNWEVYSTTTNGGEERNLSNNKADDGLPAWSPDGHWIAFLSSRGGAWAIWAMTPDGGNVRKLFDLGGSPGTEWPNERISWGQ